MRTLLRLLVAFLLTAGSITVVASPAAASCIGTPQPSTQAFTGIVLSVERQGRVATVKTDDGRTVIVRGTPADNDSVTTVDRTYTAGARYEFHPINDASPYEDNACTATHPIAKGAGPAGGTSTGDVPPAGPNVATSVAVAVGAAAILIVAVLWTMRRRVRLRAVHPHQLAPGLAGKES